MKKSIGLDWLNALESGKYQKAKGVLKTKDGFCPFGVLCDISNLSNWEYNNGYYTYFKQNIYLPKEVTEWAEISHKEKMLLTGYVFAYTDTTNLSLQEIGNILRGKFSNDKPS